MQPYTQIIQSKSDKRVYKCIQLENGLRALLIQDDEADKSCAALDVHVGAALDPKRLPGTAHFLEHMLFMGTEKYPLENEYSEFISNNGGYNNAFTSSIDTNYHFEVSNEGYAEALDRFAQFFLSPLLGDSQTEREMKAVDSEYNMSLQNDAWRKFNLLQNIAHEDSPLHKFMCGNLESLNQEGIRESLLNFHKTWYSSNIMNLVLYGKHSIEQLEQWATNLFAGVENKNVVVPNYSEPVHAFSEANLGQIARYQPVKDTDSVEIFWVLPYMEQEFRSNPLSYFSHLIGHEGENSLLSYLKQEDYAMELSAGGDHELNCFSDFTVNVKLTKKGLANVDKVVNAVFKYVQRLKEVGPQEWIFQEKRNIGTISFDFLEKGNPISYATRLAQKMPQFKTPDDLQHLLRHSYLAEHYDASRLAQVAELLSNPANCLVLVASKSFEESTLPIHEKWYKFNYSLERFSEARLGELRAAQAPDNGKALDLPPVNNLIATNFEILAEDQSLSTRPQLVQQWDGVADLWYKKDDKFKKPKGIVACKIYTGDLGFGTSAKAKVFSDVWKNVLEECLREFVYMADCAKLEFKVSLLRDNIDLQWTGFNDSLVNFVGETVKRIAAFRNGECREVFYQVKEQLMQEWKNHYLNQVFRLAAAEMDTYLYANDVEKSKLSELLASFDYETFKTMQSEWLRHGRMLWYAQGNLSKDQAKTIVDQAVTLLSLQPVPRDELTDVRVVDLSSLPENFHRLDFTVQDASNENSCLVAYFQYGRDLGIDGGKNNLINQLVMQYMQEPTFDQLRTKEQLGYVVFSRPRSARDILSAWFLVQSPGKCCEYIRSRLDVHFAKMRQKVRDLSDEEFRTVVGAVLTNISEKDKNLLEEFTRFWNEDFATHRYQFDRQARDVALLPTITKAEFQAYFEQLFFQENRANRLEMHWNSQPHILKAKADSEAPAEESKEAETDASAEPEPVPSYETEKRHISVNAFKKSCGLFCDNFKLNYTTKTFSL